MSNRLPVSFHGQTPKVINVSLHDQTVLYMAMAIALQTVGGFIDTNHQRIRKPRCQIPRAITGAASRIEYQGLGRCLNRRMNRPEGLRRMCGQRTQPRRDKMFAYHLGEILMHVLLW